MDTKSQIRKRIFSYRKQLSEEFVKENSESIFKKIIETDWYKEAEGVFLYASYNNEVDTRFITEYSLSMGKTIACPKVSVEDGELCKMNFYKISSFSDFMEGYKGIPEPIDGLQCIDCISKKSIIIVPMVAFDEKRSRIGYGKGFYDRYLSEHQFTKVIGVAFEGQKVDEIVNNPFDISPEIIYTESNVY